MHSRHQVTCLFPRSHVSLGPGRQVGTKTFSQMRHLTLEDGVLHSLLMCPWGDPWNGSGRETFHHACSWMHVWGLPLWPVARTVEKVPCLPSVRETKQTGSCRRDGLCDNQQSFLKPLGIWGSLTTKPRARPYKVYKTVSGKAAFT